MNRVYGPHKIQISPLDFRLKRFVQRLLQGQKIDQTLLSQTLLNMFRKIDHNADGFLTYGELRKAVGPNHLNMKFTDSELRDLIVDCDPDKSGIITYKEVCYFPFAEHVAVTTRRCQYSTNM